MNRNTSICLGSYYDDFIQNNLSSGRYKNASEVVRAGLRLLEEESRIMSLKKSIQEGVYSGIATDFDPEKHLAKLKTNKAINKIIYVSSI